MGNKDASPGIPCAGCGGWLQYRSAVVIRRDGMVGFGHEPGGCDTHKAVEFQRRHDLDWRDHERAERMANRVMDRAA